MSSLVGQHFIGDTIHVNGLPVSGFLTHYRYNYTDIVATGKEIEMCSIRYQLPKTANQLGQVYPGTETAHLLRGHRRREPQSADNTSRSTDLEDRVGGREEASLSKSSGRRLGEVAHTWFTPDKSRAALHLPTFYPHVGILR